MKTDKTMKRRHSSIISRMLLIGLLLTVSPSAEWNTDIFAQGIYSRNAAASETGENSKDSKDSKSTDRNDNQPGLFRAGGNEGGGNQSKISPLKDGWSILMIAGIGYGFLIAKRKRGEN
jgi:hypothetical protein